MSRKQRAYKTKHPLFFPVQYETCLVQTVEYVLYVILNLKNYKRSTSSLQKVGRIHG